MVKNSARMNHKGDTQVDMSSVEVPDILRKPHMVSVAHKEHVRPTTCPFESPLPNVFTLTVRLPHDSHL